MRSWALTIALLLLDVRPAQAHWENDMDPWLIGGTSALGISSLSPYVFGRFGVRFEEKHFFIGLELASLVQAGFAVDFQFFIVRQRKFAIHIIDPGMGWNAFGHYLSVPDVKRTFDLHLGAGFRIRACRHALATVDWQVSFPDPGMVIQSYGDYGKTIFLDALKESQIWLGVIIH
jgi:hypothetical protein